MSWSRPIDIYCERLGPELLAEPLNLITNLAFVAAGVLALRRAESLREGRAWLRLLAVVVILIGLGSGLFHSFATRWAVIADVVPIGIYMFLFVGFAAGVMLRGGWRGAILACLGLYLALAAGRALPAEWFNGSNGYFGAALGLFVLGAVARARAQPFAPPLLWAGGLFVLSLLWRSIDMLVCPSFPIGTHFLWHLCNALVLHQTLRAAEVAARSRSGRLAGAS